MRVFITGITGFVGSSLAGQLRARGHAVGGSTTGSRAASGGNIVLRLGEPVDPAIFSGVDMVVHGAFDLASGARRRNVEGTVAIARAAADAGVPGQLFVSSYSAHPGAVTDYGLAKLELEKWFLSAGHAAVRPGLVIGRGGVYARIAAVARRAPVVPVICPGAKVPVIAAADLSAGITAMIEGSVRGVARLYLDQRVTMMELLQEIRRTLQTRAVLMPVPCGLALAAATLAGALGVRLPADRDNIRGLRANQTENAPGDLLRFVPAPLGLAEMVNAAT